MTPESFSDQPTREFLRAYSPVCAARTATGTQLFFFVLTAAALVIGLQCDAKIFFTVITFVLCAVYGVAITFRLLSVFWALGRSREHSFSAEEIAALDGAELPDYTVLVPMYREPEVAEKIITAVAALDYPREKLDVKLLLEEDDELTRRKVTELMERMPPCVEVVVCPAVPPGQPKTKPRACNWGLARARGKYLVIYDAEDRPERDQLKKAVLAFRKLEQAGRAERVVCLQAKLNYFNADQNILTRFFTLEYTNWFDLFLPGLHAFRIPIPLGGTSNHFRTEVLRRAGGWDPFNVTEDCDLGIRLARLGYATEILDSTTWEEANSKVGNWIRQRSRWVKGYLQTHLVHSRESVLSWVLLVGVFHLLWRFTVPAEAAAASAGLPFAPVAEPSAAVRAVVVSIHWFCFVAQWLCVAVGAGLWIGRVRRWFRERSGRRKGPRVGALGLWDAFTFRLTVGGLSLLLLLNIIFWIIGGAYLFRHQLAEALPAFTDRFAVTTDDYGARKNLRETLREWHLYHTRVTDELYDGRTIWNTARDWAGGRLSTGETKKILAAIDPWSLISQLFYPVAVGLFLANFVFVLLGLVSCHKRKLWRLLPYALSVPLYWVLGSVAAWKGLVQLLHKPWYWEKTVHGFAESSANAGGAATDAEAVVLELDEADILELDEADILELDEVEIVPEEPPAGSVEDEAEAGGASSGAGEG